MPSIDTIVTVNITKATATVSRVGFGTPATLTYHTVFPEFARLYTSLQGMLDDGFTTSSREYGMAAAAFAQNPRPASIIIGRRANAPLRDVTMIPVTPELASTAYTVTINGEAFTFTTDATPTTAEIIAGLVALINVGGQDVLATDVGVGTSMSIESADAPGGTPTAGVPFVIEFDRKLWTFDDTTPNPGGGGIEGDLANMILANDDWYGLVSDALGKLEITALSTAIEALKKIYVAETQDSDVLTSSTSDIASLTKAASLDRTAVQYHPAAGVHQPDSAWHGVELPQVPGSSTWAFDTLATIPTYELTSAEQAFLEGKNGNHYQTVAGVAITNEGKMAGGEWMDVTQFLDWLEARIKEGAFLALAANPKIPYTDLGIQTLGGTTEDVLKEGAKRGGIDPNGATPITVTLPRASEVAAATKQARELTYTFAATLAGAVHKATINGTVTV
jgi:hypothetical protein